MTITAIRGFNDILPEDTELWRHIEDTAVRIFTGYGYSEIKAPVAEKTELFSRSIGETTDIVEKEMYTFPDRRGDSITLRPEGTAPVVRAYIEHKLYTSPVTKLYYSGPMFRYERPQKGRYRQFYQIGAEVLGDDSPRADAEALSMLITLFERLKVKGATLNINSLGCADCRPAYREKLLNFLTRHKERLCENCVRRINANPLRALDCKNPGCIEATANAPQIIDSLCGDCRDHFGKVRRNLADLGIEARVNPRMVRGLDYYTKTTFEITGEGDLGAQNAIAAGGRYDSLVKDLGGPGTPCFGFAIGLERLSLLIKETGFKGKPIVAFIALGNEAEKKGIELLRAWREKGLKIMEDFSAGALKTRMKRADRIGARFTMILGDEELKSGVVMLKDMKTARQEKVSWESVADLIAVEE